jgi:hypothetical protein
LSVEGGSQERIWPLRRNREGDSRTVEGGGRTGVKSLGAGRGAARPEEFAWFWPRNMVDFPHEN